jgi:hypothetical protein
MTEKELTELSDQELLVKRKKTKSALIINAAFIGFMIGIVVYSVVKNTYGFLTLIPLFFAYKAFNHTKVDKALEKEIKSRNLK